MNTKKLRAAFGLVSICVACLWVSSASAQGELNLTADSDAVSAAKNVPALSGLLKKGAKVKRRIPIGRDLTGWAIDFGGYTNIYYTTNDRNFLVLGAVLDPNGSNVNAAIKSGLKEDANLLSANTGKTSNAPGTGRPVGAAYDQAIYEQIKKAPSVTVGHGKKNIYVFFEPSCPHCARLHRNIGYVSGLTVHYLMVAFLSSASAPMAETVMALPRKKQAQAIDDLVVTSLSGGDPAQWLAKYKPAKLPEKYAAELKANQNLMREAGIGGTPGIIYKDARGRVQVTSGELSQSRLKAIAEMTNASN